MKSEFTLSRHAILSASEMGEAEAHAIESGITSWSLMQEAGVAVARAVRDHFPPNRVLVLAGPGNNGGDGWVAATILEQNGYNVTVAHMGGRGALRGDAATAAKEYNGATISLTPRDILPLLAARPTIIDAMFGTGLNTALEPHLVSLCEEINRSACPVIAVDIPSGVDTDTGQVMGGALRCDMTVTFVRKKRGHLLLPGRAYAGITIIAGIGIDHSTSSITIAENNPALWRARFPFPEIWQHKYERGQSVIIGGDSTHSGAARLSALAALRLCGVTTVLCDSASLPLYAMTAPDLLTKAVDASLPIAYEAARSQAYLIGPGAGINSITKNRVKQLLSARVPLVLDADAISVFADGFEELRLAMHDNVIITPHAAEFDRLFAGQALLRYQDKITRTQQAAQHLGAIILLKGADTVIAHPQGATVVNANAPATLAVAGAGDVLAGIITGLFATGMQPFDAACAGAWIHGAAADMFGLGLIASDLPGLIPSALDALYRHQE